jgi:hypothetical protein
MTKQDWLHFIKENKEEFKETLKGNIDVYAFAEKFDNIRARDGASKCCLVSNDKKYVIKWSKEFDYSDAEDECEIYKKAIEKGIAFLFPQTEILCRINGFAIVIQEQVDYAFGDMDWKEIDNLKHQCRTVSNKLITKIENNIYRSRIPIVWLKALVCIYGKKITKSFEEFTNEQKINDLHCGNVGFLNGKPIVLDFSGYHH